MLLLLAGFYFQNASEPWYPGTPQVAWHGIIDTKISLELNMLTDWQKTPEIAKEKSKKMSALSDE